MLSTIFSKPVIFTFIFLTCSMAAVVTMGERANSYTEKSMIVVSDTLADKYIKLYELLGQPDDFGSAIQQALLKPGYTTLDLLVLDELAVNEKHKEDYKVLSATMPSIDHLLHIHLTDASRAYVAGGVKLVGMEESKHEVAIFFGPVSKNTAYSIENELDGQAAEPNRERNGIVRFNRTDNMGQHYLLGLFYPRNLEKTKAE